MFLLLILVLVASLFYLIKRQYSYWDTTNIPHLETKFPLGIMGPVVQQKRSFGLLISDIYEKSTDKILGLYLLFRPNLLICDAQLARQIMTGDFNSFHDRGVYVDEVHDPLSANLFALPGQSWRTLRAKMTPSFSSGKLKGMFETIDDLGDKLVKYLNKELENQTNGKLFEMKNIMTTYAVDIIGSVIFGLDVDSFTDPENEMRKLHTIIQEPAGFLVNMFNAFSFLCPPLALVMTRLGYKDRIMQRMRTLMAATVSLREQHKIKRKDLLQLLLQLRNTGKISEDDDKIWDVETAAENLKAMSIEQIAANAFLFYIAGTETTSATAAFTLYELSMYPDLLKRAQDEVVEVLENHGLNPTNKYTYEALQDMKFLELCIMESLRKYPGLPVLNRVCTQDFKVPDTNYTIEKGTPVMIPLYSFHHDPEYFPDPSTYDPERFSEDNKSYKPAAFMPFGEGPRHCIAQRMGKINSKLAVAKVLANFDIKLQERKQVEFAFSSGPTLIAKNGLPIELKKKEK